MRRALIVAVAGLAVGLAGSAFAADAAAGKAVFDSAKPACKGCHTDTKHSLAKVGATKVDDFKLWVTNWVRTPKDQMTKEKKSGVMPAYTVDKMSDADLDNLVEYLKSLK